MSDSKSTMLLEHHLKQLKLPTMLREYPSLAAACTSDRSDYPTYLLRLCERELLDREQRAAERRIKAARFPVLKTLDSFDFTAQPSINEALVRELMSGQYIDRKENVLLVGQQRDWQDASGDGISLRRLRPGPAGTVLHGQRPGDSDAGGPGGAATGTDAASPAALRPGGTRRTGIRAFQQGRGGTALRGGQPGL